MYKQLKTLFKSGIVFFVVISAIAGYGIGFPVEGSFSFLHFLALVLGTTLISSGSLALNQIQEIKTACLWKKKSSKFTPDFCPIKLDNDPWIVQPTEHYEEMSINEVIEKQSRARD